MAYFDKFSAEFDETWADELMRFKMWLVDKGMAQYRDYLVVRASGGQQGLPQDDPLWHINHVYTDFQTAYDTYILEVKTNVV